jgi:subtilisin family serine protease
MTAPISRAESARRRTNCRPHTRTRLSFELLEDRTLLSAGIERPMSSTEVVAAIKSADPLAALAGATRNSAGLHSMIDLQSSRSMPSLPGDTMVQVALVPGSDPLQVVADLERLSFVSWAAPNFIYTADPRELTPNDPSYGSQYHHTLMKSNLAWDTTMGRAGVTIAVTDDGAELTHVDLYDNIWLNQGEIPTVYRSNLTDVDGDSLITMRDLNNAVNKGPFKSTDVNGNGRIDGLDLLAGVNGAGTGGWSDGVNNDANGYTDDLVGWDFSSGDLNPSPVGNDSHGTHVGGIAAAHTNNAVGVAGTAGNATLMPIRFYGSGSWTSTVIYNSYAYAANNGAKILTTSYNVDGFVGDPTFTAALNYIYGKGVLHFNSAGNGGANNSPRTQYDQTLYIVSTDSQDKKSGTSNYGYLTDLSAPGVSIYSTYPPNTYNYASGTSMASPNAAAVAALIWSIHPGWTRDQVAAQLLGTADNINSMNPGYENLLGAGRANSLRAVTEQLKPPTIDSVPGIPSEGGTLYTKLSNFEVHVGSVFSAASMMNAANWQLRWSGRDGQLNTSDDRFFPLTLNTNYMVGTNRFKFTVGIRTPPGLYQFKATSGGLVDPFGAPLDGNGNGVGGDHFTRNFYIAAGTGPGEDGGRSSLGTAVASMRQHRPNVALASPIASPRGLVQTSSSSDSLAVPQPASSDASIRIIANASPPADDVFTTALDLGMLTPAFV